MYAYWFPPQAQDGATLLLVSFRRNELKTGPIHRRCEALDPIEEHSIPDRRPPRAFLLYAGGLPLSQRRLSTGEMTVCRFHSAGICSASIGRCNNHHTMPAVNIKAAMGCRARM